MTAVAAATKPACPARKRTRQPRRAPAAPSIITPVAAIGQAGPPRGLLAHLLEQEVRSTVAAHTGRRVHVIFAGERAFTNNKIVVLPALPRDQLISYRNAMEIRGFTQHETLHLLESDFDALGAYLEQFEHSKMLQHLAQRFHNAIEDVRIERIGTARYAGIMNEINYTAERINQVSAASLLADPVRLTIPAFVGPVAITWIGRKLIGYPTSTNDACLDLLPDSVRQRVEQWAPEVMAATTPEAAFDLAERIARECFDELPPPLQQADPQQDDSSNAGGSGSGGGGSDTTPNQQPDRSQPDQQAGQQSGQPSGQQNPGQQQSDQQQPDTDKSNGNPGQKHNQSQDQGSQAQDQPAGQQQGQQQGQNQQQGHGQHQGSGQGQPQAQAGQAGPGAGRAAGAADNHQPSGANAKQPMSACPVEPTLVPTYGDMGIAIKPSPNGIPIAVQPLNAKATKREGRKLGKDDTSPTGQMAGDGFSIGAIQVITIHAPATRTAAHKFILPHLPRGGSRDYDYRVVDHGPIAEALAEADGRTAFHAIRQQIGSATANAVQALRRSLAARIQQRWRGNREEGVLDCRRMTDVLTGSVVVFKDRMPAPKLDTAVTVLIDNSGSMSGLLHLCQELGYVLIEAFRGTPIKSEMIGFTTGCGTLNEVDKANLDAAKKLGGSYLAHDSLNLYLFKGFDDTPVAAEVPIGNMTAVPLGGTPTATAIRAVLPRLHIRSERRKVLIVLTDGLSDHDEVRSILRLVEQLGITVIGIGLGCEDVRESFRNHIVLHKVEDLSGLVLRQLEALLADQTRRR